MTSKSECREFVSASARKQEEKVPLHTNRQPAENLQAAGSYAAFAPIII